MPLNRYVVRVDPQGQSVTVDILDTSGMSVVVYDSSQFAAVPRTLPMVITTQTDFWLRDPGPYDVSCKVGGAEVADAGAPKRVQVSDVPVLVVPDWERERTASSGGSIPDPATLGRAQYYGPNFLASDAAEVKVLGQAEWAYSSGAALLDLTNPQFPTVVAAGIYAVTANLVRVTTTPTGVAGALMYGDLTLDYSGESPIASATCPMDTIDVNGGAKAQVSLSLTGYVPTGGQIVVDWAFPGGCGDQHFEIEVMIQKLA